MRIRGKLAVDGPVVDLHLAGERIAEIRPADIASPCDLGDETTHLSPGWLDLQLNGYDGIDFNAAGTTVEQMDALTRRLRRTGVTSFCPTVVTGSAEHLAVCLAQIRRASEEAPAFAAAYLGTHLEGPYISSEDGPRGAHPREHARPPDWDEFQRLQDAAGGRIRLVTLSPEWPASTRFIERAVEQGILVAIGHTAASPAQIAEAVRAGARMSTHLGNGSHAKIDRHPNYIWEQLAADDLCASFIVDGHHLPPSVVKCFLRCKGVDRSILVTDAIAAAGKPPGRHALGPIEVEVTPQGRVCLPGTPYLAGSVLEMQQALARTVLYSDATLDQAIQMATRNPAEALSRSTDLGRLEPGRRADLVLFRWDGCADALDVHATIVGGALASTE